MGQRSEEASPIVRVAIAGLGAAGCMMIPALLKPPSIKITAAADIDPAQLEKFRGDFQAETFRSVEELCKSSKVDAIYIATPTPYHTEHTLMALEHRKDVVIEKPMALSLTDTDAMIAAAACNGVQLVVGHSHSFEPPIRKIREIVRSGELGGCACSTTGIAPTGSTAIGTSRSWTPSWAVG